MTHLQEMAKQAIDTGAGSRLLELATRDDFPAALRNSLNKVLLKGYNAQGFWFEPLVSFRDARDFRDMYLTRMSNLEDLEEVPEGAEYKDSELREEESNYRVRKFGRIFGLSWEGLVNDDLGALSRQVKSWGVSARRTVNKTVTTLVTSNPNMDYDGSALFGSGHGNLGVPILSASGLAEGFAAMVSQTDQSGELCGIAPRFLVVPPQLWLDAVQLTTSSFMVGDSEGHAFNYVKELALAPIRNDMLSDQKAWYLFADPSQFDTIEVAFLFGQREPTIAVESPDSGKSFSADIIQYRARLVFNCKAVDHRSLYKSTGEGT